MANKHLQAAIALAELSRCKYKHGAILVKSGQVIAAGVNLQIGSVSDTSWRCSSLHAEENVLMIAGTSAVGATLYVARVNKAGEPRLSLPCGRCRGKIMRAKLARVVTT